MAKTGAKKMRRHKSSKKHEGLWKAFFDKSFKLILLSALLAIFIMPFMAYRTLAADDAGEKLAEGVEETATSWTDIPENIAETSEESNPIEGITVGTIQGTGEAVEGTVKGAVKAATFFVPDSEESKDTQ